MGRQFVCPSISRLRTVKLLASARNFSYSSVFSSCHSSSANLEECHDGCETVPVNTAQLNKKEAKLVLAIATSSNRVNRAT